MMGFNLYIVFAVVAIISGSAHANYGQGDYAAPIESPSDYQLQGINSNADSASAAASANSIDGNSLSHAGSNLYGSSQNIPYTPGNTRGNTLTSSITYPQNKGEILIHRPAAIIVKRPPTKVLVNHPPLVVKPAPLVLHKPPAVVLRKVFVKQHPRPVKVEPVYVNVVKPPAEKYFVNEKQALAAGYGPAASIPAPTSSAASSAALGSSQYASNNDAVNSGYQLLPSGLNLGNYAGQGAAAYNPSY